MRYPIKKFLEGHGQWWYVNAIFEEPPKEINRMVLDPANGVAKGEGGCLLLWKRNKKHSYIPVKIWGEHRPVVESNRHNWFSAGVTS